MGKKMLNLVTIIVMFLNLCSIVYATSSIGDIISVGPITGTPISEIKVTQIIGTIKWLGYVIAIGMIIWCGIKFLMSGVVEKAKMKETLIPILIGAVLIVAGVEITAAVFKLFGA